MTTSKSSTVIWLKSKAQSSSVTTLSLGKPKEVRQLATENLLDGLTLNNIFVSRGRCADTIIGALKQVQVEPMHFLKAKITYFPCTMVLIIYSPHPVYDQTTSEISSAILNIYLEDIFTIPDMQLTLTSITSEAVETEVLCTALTDKSLHTYTSITPHRDADNLFGPVKAMDHSWIHVSKVEYFIWLKEDNNIINVKNSHVAYGISIALNQGMDMDKSVMCTKLDVLQPQRSSYTKHDHIFSGTKHRHALNGHDEVEPERPLNRRVIAPSTDEDTGPVTSTSTSGSTSSSGGSISSGVDSSSGKKYDGRVQNNVKLSCGFLRVLESKFITWANTRNQFLMLKMSPAILNEVTKGKVAALASFKLHK
ncbi:hypothetical protein BDR07DRAFT_1374820 [Suillus spraguei]|nr:hypothetical protein BDR07DRAFT_1374820 [Suillus spraguei]